LRARLEKTCFGAELDSVWEQLQAQRLPPPAAELQRAERDPRQRMRLVFRWYLRQGVHRAREGREQDRLNYRVFGEPAVGALNQALAGSSLADWRSRTAPALADHLMGSAAQLLRRRGCG
jgi:trans-AT polyketide synthase/acyltransferase/oxidoreductase domain-containing protein